MADEFIQEEYLISPTPVLELSGAGTGEEARAIQRLFVQKLQSPTFISRALVKCEPSRLKVEIFMPVGLCLLLSVSDQTHLNGLWEITPCCLAHAADGGAVVKCGCGQAYPGVIFPGLQHFIPLASDPRFEKSPVFEGRHSGMAELDTSLRETFEQRGVDLFSAILMAQEIKNLIHALSEYVWIRNTGGLPPLPEVEE